MNKGLAIGLGALLVGGVAYAMSKKTPAGTTVYGWLVGDTLGAPSVPVTANTPEDAAVAWAQGRGLDPSGLRRIDSGDTGQQTWGWQNPTTGSVERTFYVWRATA